MNDGSDFQLDLTNAIALKLVFFAIVQDPTGTPVFKDLVSGQAILLPAGITVVNDPTHGWVIDIDETTHTGGIVFTNGTLGNGGTGIDFVDQAQYMTLAKSDAQNATSVENIAAIRPGSGQRALGDFEKLSNESFQVAIGNAGNNDNTSFGLADWTVWNVIGGSRQTTLGQRTIINGTENGRDTGGTNAPNDVNDDPQIGDANDNPFAGQIAFFAIFDEELTTAENSSFASDPWQVLQANSSDYIQPGVLGSVGVSGFVPGLVATHEITLANPITDVNGTLRASESGINGTLFAGDDANSLGAEIEAFTNLSTDGAGNLENLVVPGGSVVSGSFYRLILEGNSKGWTAHYRIQA